MSEYIPPYQPCEPITCQTCLCILPNKYFDAKLRHNSHPQGGSWANMCPSCYVQLAYPHQDLRTEFNRQTNGSWKRAPTLESVHLQRRSA